MTNSVPKAFNSASGQTHSSSRGQLDRYINKNLLDGRFSGRTLALWSVVAGPIADRTVPTVSAAEQRIPLVQEYL
jgi:hypothetical protein